MDARDELDAVVLGGAPSLNRQQVCEQAGVPLEVAIQLWALLGFAAVGDDEVVFTPADVDALRATQDLVELGILSADRQAALVRTWGRSFARLAEWQSTLLATVAAETGLDPEKVLPAMAGEVLPRVEALQAYVWRRHLVNAGSRLLGVGDAEGAASLGVGFVDIVGYTSRSRALAESELVAWLESFEARTTAIVLEHGGQVIKNIGDEVLFVADDAASATRAALALVARGNDEADDFPAVRAGVAYGPVVRRLGDVFGETVNIAARLTSAARAGTVLVDRGVHETLVEGDSVAEGLEFRRLHRIAAKGYSRLAAFAVRITP